MQRCGPVNALWGTDYFRNLVLKNSVHQLARGDHPPVSLAASRAHRGGRSDSAMWIALSEGNRTSPGGGRA